MPSAKSVALTAILCFLTPFTLFAQAPLPSGWPSRLELGLADGPNGAAALRATTTFGFRYQYLAGGVNTGNGWATWNPNGDFVRFYIQESIAAGITPAFSYYMLRQSYPGGGDEREANYINANNADTMTAFYNDLMLFFQRAGAFPSQRVFLHVEPDFWGHMQHRLGGDDARLITARVSDTGIPQLAGLPNTVSGLAQAIVRLRDVFAPNVWLGYHLSVWGTRTDISLQDPPDDVIDQLTQRSAAFYRSLDANFDVVVAEFSDRDAAYFQYVANDGGRSWWDDADFRRNLRYLGGFSAAVNRRLVMWQIPLGNTKMRAMNNWTGHYQDNRPELLLDDPNRTKLTAYRDAGVIALLFGAGAPFTTCACDLQGDGVTNPGDINGNVIASELAPPGTTPQLTTRNGTPTLVTPHAADDDGGFFKWKALQYYQNGALSLSGGGGGGGGGGGEDGSAPRRPTNVRIVR